VAEAPSQNEKQAKVERKVAHVVKITATERHCQSCEETDAKCTTFAGVELQPGGRCEPASDTLPELPASPTWRQVAAVLEAALWAMRVRTAGIPQRLTTDTVEPINEFRIGVLAVTEYESP
jgi:hypothetical protein